MKYPTAAVRITDWLGNNETHKMQTIILLAITVALCGCATPGHRNRPVVKQSTRQAVGRSISDAGQNIGKVGTGIIMAAGMSIVALPLVVIGIPVLLAAIPIYYGGAALAGDETESDPFSL